tara:strand:- start:2473 stop:3204 length:732 start_codon:yes stop_codon:yes gene_type:complete
MFSKSIKSQIRITLLLSFSIYLFYLLKSHAFRKIYLNQVYLSGNEYIQETHFEKYLSNLLPQHLILINSKRMENELMTILPIKYIQIRRELIPPKISIQIRPLKGIAHGSRDNEYGKEYGMIDISGKWISSSFYKNYKINSTYPFIDGWKEDKKNIISKLLKQRENTGGKLNKILISDSGSIILRTSFFNEINLGSKLNSIDKQIKVLIHLKKTLTDQKNATLRIKSIDIKDPSKPELKVFKP